MTYARQIATAKRLIDKYGGPVTITRKGVATTDPVTGRGVAATPLTFQCKGVMLSDLGTLGSSHDETVSNDNIVEKSSKRLIISAARTTFAPLPEDHARFKGRDWRVVTADALEPNGNEPIIYTLSCKAGG